MNKFIDFLEKNCYISAPTALTAFFIFINKKVWPLSVGDEEIGIIISLLGTLVGFLLTAITVFLSLPKDKIVIQRVKKYKHHIIFSKCISLGIIFSCLTILLWMFKIPNNYILICFLISITETMIAAYYIYKLCLYSFE